MSITEDLAERLMEELNCETVFTIPVFGGIPIAESVVVSWIIMAVLTILSICLVRNLKVENPGKKQLALEVAIGGIYKFFDNRLQTTNQGLECDCGTCPYEHRIN